MYVFCTALFLMFLPSNIVFAELSMAPTSNFSISIADWEKLKGQLLLYEHNVTFPIVVEGSTNSGVSDKLDYFDDIEPDEDFEINQDFGNNNKEYHFNNSKPNVEASNDVNQTNKTSPQFNETLINITEFSNPAFEDLDDAFLVPNQDHEIPSYPDATGDIDYTDTETRNETIEDLYFWNNVVGARNQCPNCRCGIRFKNRIVGGTFAARYEFPWQAMVTYHRRFTCGGVLINDRYVLTAAHCTYGFQTRGLGVRLLEYNRARPNETPVIIRSVKKVIRPRNYNPSRLNNDISLMKLSRSVPLGNKLLRSICLPIPGSSYGGHRGIVSGWGATSSATSSGILRKVVVPILKNGRCKRTLVGNAITDKMICAGRPWVGGVDSCQGDSGGPLMVLQNRRLRLAGIVSWGRGCGLQGNPGVYTRVTKYVRWIRKNTRDACYCAA